MARFGTATEENSFDGKGLSSYAPAYAATINLTPKAAFKTYVKPAQLTGALTLNVDVTKAQEFDEFVFQFSTDGTQRVVTFGTGVNASGTITIPANKKAIAVGYFDGTVIQIASREIGA